jgi:hypothetical protein
MAARLPVSEPGTLFGIRLATLRDAGLERKALIVAGLAVLASIVVPYHFSPTAMSWDLPKFRPLVWPIIAGVVYLAVGLSPASVRNAVPPVVLKWAPFTVAFLSIGIIGTGIGYFEAIGGASEFVPGGVTGMGWGYAALVFGLLARLNHPSDSGARAILGVGAAVAGLSGLTFIFDIAFELEGVGGFAIVHNLALFLIVLLCLACTAFVPTPEQVPALRSCDAFAPLVTAVLLAWLPVQMILLGLDAVRHDKGNLMLLVHGLVVVFAYFGILMLTAPEAYDQAKRLFARSGVAYSTHGYRMPPGAPQAGPPPGYASGPSPHPGGPRPMSGPHPHPGAPLPGYGAPPPGYGAPPPSPGAPPPGYGAPPPGYGAPPPGYGGPPPSPGAPPPGHGAPPPGYGGPPPMSEAVPAYAPLAPPGSGPPPGYGGPPPMSGPLPGYAPPAPGQAPPGHGGPPPGYGGPPPGHGGPPPVSGPYPGHGAPSGPGPGPSAPSGPRGPTPAGRPPPGQGGPRR